MTIFSASIFTLLFLGAHLILCSCCEDGWTEHSGHCYYVEQGKMTFDDAQCACNANDAYLVKLDNQAETDFVTGLLKDTFWIGTRRACVGGDSNIWLMIHDLTEATFTSWSPHEPNNSGGNENCVEIRTSNLWNDLECSDELKSVCERGK
ncbi:hepatic lectin-like [Ptychodera flava]|uniref:hepatic lectin-like n=1 Tax=Ptychodera flava TaxID=63121 RepID=UPI00396A9A54